MRERRRRKQAPSPAARVLVDRAALAPNNSYGAPAFVERGYYLDEAFTCARCGTHEVWTATQQKW